MMSKVQTIHLFNCDQTYKFDSLEEWLEREKSKQGFSVQQHYFPLSKMAEMSEETIPRLNMDLAVFVVHAHESRLSINEEKAGIGYAKIYRALLQKTGDNVIIVIGGDDNYRDEDEKNEQFISRWARRKVSSQFNDEYMDGRKGFILSWNEKHREVHEETLRHFLDPSKRGTKFEYKPKRKLLPKPVTAPGDLPQQSRSDSFLPEKPIVKGATIQSPETERLSRPVKVASNPLQQSRPNSSSTAGPSRVRDSYKPEGRGDSSFQSYGNTQVEVSSLLSGGTQEKLIDLAVFGCSVSEKSIKVSKEVLGRLRSQLHISSENIKHFDSPEKVKSCLLKEAVRFCVLLVDAETVTDAYSNLEKRRMEYENLLKTAAATVAEKVIVVIFAPCSLPSKEDEVVVMRTIESILLATGKGLLEWVEEDSITPKALEEKILRAIRPEEFPNLGDSRPTSAVEYRFKESDRTVHDPLTAHSSQHLCRYGYDRDQDQSQERMYMQSRGPPGASGGLHATVSAPSDKKLKPVQLSQNETVMLKTRLRYGEISMKKGDLEIFYPQWEVPLYVIQSLYNEHHLHSNLELCIISDEKGNLSVQVRTASAWKKLLKW